MLTFSLSIAAQQIGTWEIYPARTYCSDLVVAGSRIYALTENNLMAYDTEDQSIVEFDWMHQLNDVTITNIAYSAEARHIIIVYDNGNIDLLSTTDDNDVTNLSQLKNSTAYVKTVNSINVYGTKAYLCMTFGIIVVDMEAGVIENTYQIEKNILSCAVTNTRIIAGTDEGTWGCELTENLLDKSNWKQMHASLKPRMMTMFNGELWALHSSYLFSTNANETGFTAINSNLGDAPKYMKNCGDKLIIGGSNKTYIFSSKTDYEVVDGTFTWSTLSEGKNLFWASDGYDGLQAYTLADGHFNLATSHIQPNSPLHDYSLHLRFAGDRLMVAGGEWNYAELKRPGTAMILEADGTWTNFDYRSATEALPKERYIDVTNVVQDPQDENHHYAGTARSGIFEFRNGKCVGHIGMENSPLKSILPDVANPHYYVSADGLTYDSDGNLWMLNCIESQSDSVIRIMKPDGKWIALPTKNELPDVPTADKIYFDSAGRVWVNSRRVSSRGIYMLDTKGTLERSSDDVRLLRQTIVNQDGTTYSPDEFYDIKEDREGNIWVGTNLGPFVITEPENFRSSAFTFEQVKISRNDGSGLADYLLNGVAVTCIAVDGANRKWFGSINNGVYLLSADCQEELAHFTTDNSPLQSNEVYDIAIHPRTGRVYFATRKGLCSYLSDATEGEEELAGDNITISPNPVAAEYTGPVVVRGLVADAEVKIVAPTGQLISSGHSNGGTFTWNACDQRGRKVASGIYTLIVNTADGKTVATARLAIIR